MTNGPSMLATCDRALAAMRGGWRCLGAALLIGATALLYRSRDWPLMWRTDTASCLALASVTALLGLSGSLLVMASLRWLLFAAWPAPTGVYIDGHALCLRLGPFGVHRFDWPRIRIDSLDEDDLLIDAELVTPRIFHPDHVGDLSETISRFCKLTPAHWRRILDGASKRPPNT